MDFDEGMEAFAPSEESAYSLDRIYARAYDKQGHAESVRADDIVTQFLPSIKARMGEIRMAIPEYRTFGDFIRDAVVHRLMYWESMDGKLPRNVSLQVERQELLLRLDTNRKQLETAKQLVSDMRGQFHAIMNGQESFEDNISAFLVAVHSLNPYPNAQQEVRSMATELINRFGTSDGSAD